MNRRLAPLIILVFAAAAALAAAPRPALALRANMHRDLGKLEQMGRYEEALFIRRSTMEMVLALHCRWSGAPYDPAMDRVLGMTETRTDRRYWNIVNDQRVPITELLAKAKLTPAQRNLLDLRVRVYVENHLSPDFDEMGNFYFARKAAVYEQAGMFFDASFRRRLVGYYARRVCTPWYETMAAELKMNGDAAAAAGYLAAADRWRQQADREFHRSNGDRLLGKLNNDNRNPQPRQAVINMLVRGLKLPQADARQAAVAALADMGATNQLLAAADDTEAVVRREAARAFADAMFVPGLAALAGDKDAETAAIVKAAVAPSPSDLGAYVCALRALAAARSDKRCAVFATAALTKLQTRDVADEADWIERATGGLAPGVQARYFDRPGAAARAEAILPAVATGMRGNERFPKKLQPLWHMLDVVPGNANGQFMVTFEGKLYVPEAGHYRFYVKTDGDNRATVKLGQAGKPAAVIISPRNDREMLNAVQTNYQGGVLTRVDFSRPVDLPRGMVDLQVEYKGAQIKGKDGLAGLRLYFSSDGRVMQPVPAELLFHAK